MPMLYALVARDNRVISEYSDSEGEFTATARRIVKSSEKSSVFKSFTQCDKTYSFLTDNELTFLCYGDCAVGKDISLKFLQEMRSSFNEYRTRAGAYAEVIQRMLNVYKGETDELSGAEVNLNSAIESTRENIGKLIERGTNMNVLMDKASSLNSGLSTLKKKTRKFKSRALFQKLRLSLVLFTLSMALLYLLQWWLFSPSS